MRPLLCALAGLALLCAAGAFADAEPSIPFRGDTAWSSACDRYMAVQDRLDVIEETVEKTVEHLEAEVKGLLGQLEELAWNLPPGPVSATLDLLGDGEQLRLQRPQPLGQGVQDGGAAPLHTVARMIRLLLRKEEGRHPPTHPKSSVPSPSPGLSQPSIKSPGRAGSVHLLLKGPLLCHHRVLREDWHPSDWAVAVPPCTFPEP
ncbi:Placenta-specific protein 9 [Galemys pyrenaicus]|uniref:Placenta-specific protein 9 n=1 Tax=Galemys pyrenaicus TaxID=202257 RepID=A0A8J6ALX8_GALPY|nr:Placenta-specific protein 9 [Galemys pyrenaicus]